MPFSAPRPAKNLDYATPIDSALRAKAEKLNKLAVLPRDSQQMREQLCNKEVVSGTLYLANHICCNPSTSYCTAARDENGQLKDPNAPPPVNEDYLIATLERVAYIYSKGHSCERGSMEREVVDRLKRSTGISKKWMMGYTEKGKKALPLIENFASTKVFISEPPVPVLEHAPTASTATIYTMKQNDFPNDAIQTVPVSSMNGTAFGELNI